MTEVSKNKIPVKKRNFFQKLNEKYFYENYRKQNEDIGKPLTIKQYIANFIKYAIISFVGMYLIFPSLLYASIASFVLTIFILNEVSMNAKIMGYEYYVLCELCNYTQNMTALLKVNNVYNSLISCCELVGEPIRSDLVDVIEKISKKSMSVRDAFQAFNEKYNYRTVTLFNQNLDLIDTKGGSKAESMLNLVSKELDDIRIKKDRYLKFKKEWRTQFYIVLVLCMVLPVMLKYMIPDIYIGYMNDMGNYIMFGVIVVNMFVIRKVEGIYRNQDIGDGGGR